MSDSRLSTSLITYGESLLRLNEARAEEARIRGIFIGSNSVVAEFAALTKAAEDVFHVAADELAEAWRAEFKDVAMQLVAAVQSNQSTKTITGETES